MMNGEEEGRGKLKIENKGEENNKVKLPAFI